MVFAFPSHTSYLVFDKKIFPLLVQAMTEIGKTIYRSKFQLQQARLHPINGNKTVVVGAWKSCDTVGFFHCEAMGMLQD